MNSSRPALVLGVAVAAGWLSGCTRPLTLSNALAPEGERPLHAMLALIIGEPSSPAGLIDSTIPIDPPWPFTPADVVEGSWADSARVGFTAAVRDLLAHGNARHAIDSASVEGLAVQLVHVSRPAPYPRSALSPTIWGVSSIGFNEDSTFAALYFDTSCGVRCGSGGVALFARHAGRRWTLWSRTRLWVI